MASLPIWLKDPVIKFGVFRQSQHVTRLDDMSAAARVFHQEVEKWKVTADASMDRMFVRAIAFNQSVEK